MSVDPSNKKRKDKKKKKDDTAPLLEESDGSGACAKIVFLVLLSSLGMAIGVIFFEMGGMQTLNSLMNHESIIEAPPVKYDPPTTPMDVDDDFYKIDPSPINPESLKDDKIDVITDAVEVVNDPPVEIVETVTETVVVPEVVVKEIEEEIVVVPVVEAEIVEIPTVKAEVVEEPVVQITESVPVTIEEQQVVTDAIEEEPIVISENFETQLENEPIEVPQESFTMRAEREAVQGAVDEVWVMTVRCIEELRALQVMAKSSLTHAVIDTISQRLEPLRSQLDDLVKNTSENVFDGALEQAAELERNLRVVLGELDEARNQDTILAEEVARQEQLAAEAAEAVNEEPEEVVAEIQAEETNEEEEENEEQEVTSSVEDVIAGEPELEAAAPKMVEEESEAELEPVVAEVEVKEEVVADEPEIEVAPEIFEEVVQLQNDQPTVKEDATFVPEIVEESVEELEQNVEQELKEDVGEPELEVETPEVVEEEAQADQPIIDVEQAADVVSNEVAEETITVPEIVESAEEQIIDDSAPEIILETDESVSVPSSEKPLSEADYRFMSEEEEQQEVQEPVQIATEAFVVEPEEQAAAPKAESIADVPSRMQNLEEADRLVDQAPPAA